MRSLVRNPLVLLGLFTLYSLAVGAAVVMAVSGSPDATASGLNASPPRVSLGVGVPITFTVEEGVSGEDIADELAEAGVISDKRRFEVLLNLTGGSADLDAGCYVFAARTPAAEVVLRLRSGRTSLRSLPIPEGRRVEEVGDLLERAGVATQEAWRAALEQAPRDKLPEPPPGNSLNGYLFPATYPVECHVDAARMVEAMLDAFTEQVTPELIEEAKRSGLSLHEVVTLASIVEREAVLREEQPVIASVFLNRLADGIALQADPTVQYAIAATKPPAGDGEWWKAGLTGDDLDFESPYNTYLNRGLPPGPIANPGIDAVKAVIRPARTDYLYFVAKGDGSHAFAATLAEHNANVRRYQDE